MDAVRAITAVVLMMGVLAPAAGAVAAPTVAAQDDATPPTSNTTNATTPTTVHELEDESGETVARITSVDWDGRTVTVTVEAEEYTTIAITDAGAMNSVSEGSSEEIPYEEYTVPGGETRSLEFTVRDTGTRAVTVKGGETLVGIVEERGLLAGIGGDVGWDSVYAGVATAAGVVGAVALVSAVITWYAMRRDYRRVI